MTDREKTTATAPSAGWRVRWAAFGAALAVAVGAVATGGTVPIVDAITSSGQRAVYTAITPCRLADTRPDPAFNVGTRSTPIGAGETHTFAARGAQGQCAPDDLPADAVALALNVTALNATANGFLTVWPGGPRPNAASLNPAPGQPPAPNAVTTQLSATGSFDVYNENGTTDVVIDVVGVLTDHDHDDRYEPNVVNDVIDPHMLTFDPFLDPGGWTFGPWWSYEGPGDGCVIAPLHIPVGRSVSAVDITYFAAADVDIRLSVISTKESQSSFARVEDLASLHLKNDRTLPASGADRTVSIRTPHDPNDVLVTDPPLSPLPEFHEPMVTLCVEDDITLLDVKIVLAPA